MSFLPVNLESQKLTPIGLDPDPLNGLSMYMMIRNWSDSRR